MKSDYELTPQEWLDKYGETRPRNVFLCGPMKGMLAHGSIVCIAIRLEVNGLVAPDRLFYESDRAYCQRIGIAFPGLIDDCLASLGWDK